MTVNIETASIRHIEKLYEIEKECFGEESFSKAQIRHLLTNYSSVALMANEDSGIVGFIIGDIQYEREAILGRILTIDVAVKYRRMGIGFRLLEEMERIFKQKGATISRLEVRQDNIAAISLYRKRSYVRIATLRNYYGLAHGLCLAKKLT